MNSKFKRTVSILLIALTLLSVGVTSVAAASYSALSQNINSSAYAKVFTIQRSGKIPVYTNSNLNTRGTETYGRSSTAHIAAGSDENWLLGVGVNSSGTPFARVSLPIGSGKRAIAYIALSQLSPMNGDQGCYTATSKFLCAKRYGDSLSSSYYIDAGEQFYYIGCNGSQVQLLYKTSAGIWRLGWTSATNFQKYAVRGVTLYGNTTLNGKGSTQILRASVTPSTASSNIIWSSSNTNVATVSNGVVKAVSNGTATITAKVRNTNLKGQLKVTVKNCNSSTSSSISTFTKTITLNDFTDIASFTEAFKLAQREAIFNGEEIYRNHYAGEYYNGNIITNMEVVSWKTLTVKRSMEGPGAYELKTIKFPKMIKFTLHKHKLDNTHTIFAGDSLQFIQNCSCNNLWREWSMNIPWEILIAARGGASIDADSARPVSATYSQYPY